VQGGGKKLAERTTTCPASFKDWGKDEATLRGGPHPYQSSKAAWGGKEGGKENGKRNIVGGVK